MTIARRLRAARLRAGSPTLKDMSARCGVAVGALSRAQNGDPRMTWRTVRGWAYACGEPIEPWQKLWTDLRQKQDRLGQHGRCAISPLGARARTHWTTERHLSVVPGITTMSELLEVLSVLRDFCGLSLRQMAEAAGGFSHTTFNEVLKGRRPMTHHHLSEILIGCGVPDTDRFGWYELRTHLRFKTRTSGRLDLQFMMSIAGRTSAEAKAPEPGLLRKQRAFPREDARRVAEREVYTVLKALEHALTGDVQTVRSP